jgi:putative DNA primase/helicase
MSSDNFLLRAALAYASRGWPVFPCNPKNKLPLVGCDRDGNGKEIPNTGGVKKATIDPELIRAWWTKWPSAMIALACGREAGVFVVDFDVEENSDGPAFAHMVALITRLEAELQCRLPATWEVNTPRGGRHLYFQYVEGIGNRTALLGKGSHIDIRGEGGYVFLPPSKRADGKPYAWGASQPVLKDELPAKAPEPLRDCALRLGKWAPPAPPPGAPRPTKSLLRLSEVSDAGKRAVEAYAAAALARESHEVEQAGRGERNNRLNIAAVRLGEFIAAGALAEDEVRRKLEAAAQANGLSQDDGVRTVQKTIDSGLRKGITAGKRDLFGKLAEVAGEAEERAAAAVGRLAKQLPPDLHDERLPPKARRARGLPPAAPADLALRPMTDLGNAERLKERFRDRLRWCPAMGWLAWDDRRWNRNNGGERARAAAQETARAIQEEAGWLRGRPEDIWIEEKKKRLSTLLAAWGRNSEGHMRLCAMLEEAKPFLVVDADELDTDPFKINVLNGTLWAIDDSAGPYIELRPHDPRDLITKLAPVVYDPDAPCPQYDAFLEKVQPSAHMRRFLHQWGGMSLTGDTSEQVMTFHHGMGKNGKSTLFNAWGYVAGDYGRTIPIETFLESGKARTAGAPSPDLAMLAGVRFLRTSEPERGSRLGEAIVKLAIGSEPMSVRHLNREYFMLQPAFKLTMSGNHKPIIGGTDEGIWRRVRLVPWEVEIPQAERVLDFDKHRLKPEMSGILNRLLAGLLDWLEHRLVVPDEVFNATAEYRRESDVLGRALGECTEPDPLGRVQVAEWHRVFCAWARANGEREWKTNGLSRAMHAKGYKTVKSNGRYWAGFRLTCSVSDFIDEKGQPRVAVVEETTSGEEFVPF